MESYDAIVVGGGPAGSACARRLVGEGASVVVLDRDVFPRTKLCAGWVTPQAMADLDLEPADYPHRLNTFSEIMVHAKGLTFPLRGIQYSIRRLEFDDYLLKRSGAELRQHNVKEVTKEGESYVVDGVFRARYLVGAGGTRCPVYRALFRDANPRARELQAATYEHEFPYQWTDERCHLWFFDKGLPGYSWYVPKADGYLNCGIGAMADKLKARGQDIRTHWRHFVSKLAAKKLVPSYDYEPKGYSYYLRGGVDVVRVDNAFITGDAVGLATRDLCEGIGPAVRSGVLAAEAITHGVEYSLEALDAFSANRVWVQRLLEYMFINREIRTRGRRMSPAPT